MIGPVVKEWHMSSRSASKMHVCDTPVLLRLIPTHARKSASEVIILDFTDGQHVKSKSS